VAATEGWVAKGWDDVRGAFERNFDKAREAGAAFCAYHRGEKVVDLWGGVADLTDGRPWDEDTMVLVYSTTKGATAMCANRLADEGALDVEAPVREYWPEFARAGKDGVTVADLLSHRAGLAWTDGPMSLEDVFAWDPVVKALEAQAPSWTAGTAHGYHATTYGWLVGEVVRRISGRSLGTYLRDEIAEPLGADFYVGLPDSELPRVARLVPFSLEDMLEFDGSSIAAGSATPSGESAAGGAGTGQVEAQQEGFTELVSSFLGEDGPLLKALTAPGGALADEKVWDDPRLYAAEIPAANGICDARSLALLYSSCVSDVAGPSGERFRAFGPKQLDRALQQETRGPDSVLFGLDIQWGLGFMLNRGIVAQGWTLGERSFGHFGMGGSVGWADPDSELAMGYVMNRMAIGTTGDSRSFGLVSACAEAARKA